MTGLKLAGEFAGADREAWARQAIAGLKGRPLEGLTSRTYDGIVVEPVVPRAEAPAPLPAYRRGWQTMQRIDMPDFGTANGQALDDLENGADGLCLVWPESLAAGRHGVPVTGPRDLARLFEGVHLDLIRLRLDAGRFGRPAAALVAEFYEARSASGARPALLAPRPGGRLRARRASSSTRQPLQSAWQRPCAGSTARQGRRLCRRCAGVARRRGFRGAGTGPGAGEPLIQTPVLVRRAASSPRRPLCTPW